MNYIEVERVLEVISDAVMNIEGHFKKESPCIMPSFKEKQDVVERLKLLSKFDFDNDILFCCSGETKNSPVEMLPLYNYLVLEPVVEFNEEVSNYEVDYIIRGFDSFGGVNDYVVSYTFNSMCAFFVYVDGYYRELLPRFSVVNKGVRKYVSAFSFVFDTDLEYEIKVFELLGLCEFINKTKGEFECYTAQCVEDIADHLFMGKCQQFVDLAVDKEEDGYIYFENKFFPYRIVNDSKSFCCWVELYAPDGSGRVYDSESHEFVVPTEHQGVDGIGWDVDTINTLEDLVH